MKQHRLSARKSAPVKRSRVEVPRILSADEKRELILAHTAARRPLDAAQKVSLWAGVIVCSVFAAAFWLYSSHDGITRALAGPKDEVVSSVLQSGAEITDAWESENEKLKNINSEVEKIVGQIEAKLQEQEILEQIGGRLASDQAASSSNSTASKE